MLIRDTTHIRKLKISKQLLLPFEEVLVDFVSDVSSKLLSNQQYKEYPELIALGFWMRKANVNKLRESFLAQNKNKVLLGRGVVFHIAPSNVDTIFVYSWFISLLVGNSNIIRISSKQSNQTNILLSVINDIIQNDKYEVIRQKMAVVSYGHEKATTDYLSLLADIRVIWGGNETINNIRESPIKPTCIELTFANKFSFTMIKSKDFLDSEQQNKIIANFYNDAFLFGQMACSSTRLVAWVGEEKESIKAKEIFWMKLKHFVNDKDTDDIEAADVINKLVAECESAIINPKVKNTILSPQIHKINIDSIKEIKEELHCGAGLFYEVFAKEIEEIFSHINKSFQTISQLGFDKLELQEILYKYKPEGIDRIINIGQAMDFHYIWDGFNLFNSFCREITIEEN